MNRTAAFLLAAGLFVSAGGLAGSSAAAKPEAVKPDQVLRCARTYAEAMAEAKDRSCVVFATFHDDG